MAAVDSKANEVQFGLDTFGDRPALGNGELMSHPDSIRQVVKEGVLADQVGVDIFALGEHHRPDYAISSPEPILGTLAGLTDNIKLGSAVTVLSSDDPVRVFQRFATLDALSNGRAQVMLGRGSFTESFPLFGYDLADYDVLFEEKLNLFVELLKEQPVTWSGSTRASLNRDEVFPKTESGHLDAVIGVGGSPQSVMRAARYDLPLMLAIIGGDPRRFSRYIDLYNAAAQQFGTTPHKVGMHSPGFVADTDEAAINAFWPHFQVQRNRIGAERGWGPTSIAEFERELNSGSLYVGSPETVAQKMASTIKDLGVGRFDLTYTFGPQPADDRLRHVELYGTKVIPRVKELLADG
jgi:probable LLM family oxidoreductase